MSTASAQNKPNLLLVFTDQQRRQSIRAAGASWMKTPNIDRLVNEAYP